ncbi:oxidative damage protection protein [Gilvimarinus chinensis]|uniref:oxidative damage protection protein n=1 Tax=Gilvimarinus chinensis TaxID=396005 RepID=UPI00037EFC41|nr:oxidative damage protection protein [Gilvimarinus chinensis]
MSRTVFCRKYKQELPGLAQPPYPGAKGQDIFENVSAKAWQEWLSHQTMLINEKQLNLMDTATRVYLGEQMTKFLSGDDYDAAEGYVPPQNDK